MASFDWLVTPERFSKQEIAAHAVKVSATADNVRSGIANWLHKTGGVNGKALGLHADLLRPPQRVVEAFETVMRGLDVAGGRP